ncbi:MAG: N-acetyltransferase [Candidatus Hydrogenedentes bacterium]|nr:N-acetyltransferase [Candidatus Hydrogenedentota bacterium]
MFTLARRRSTGLFRGIISVWAVSRGAKTHLDSPLLHLTSPPTIWKSNGPTIPSSRPGAPAIAPGSRQVIAPDVEIGERVVLRDFVNLYGCQIGDDSRIGTFVEIQKGVRVGRSCKISSHTFICEGVTIEDNVFIGHGVTFINDAYPRATCEDGRPQTEVDWECIPTRICEGASIGSGATILCGVTVGQGAMVGAGSVVTRDVPPNAVVAGNPARILRSTTVSVQPGNGR